MQPSNDSLRHDIAAFIKKCAIATEHREHFPALEADALGISSAMDALSAEERKAFAQEIEAVVAALNAYIAVMEEERDAAGAAISDQSSHNNVCSAYAKMQKMGK